MYYCQLFKQITLYFFSLGTTTVRQNTLSMEMEVKKNFEEGPMEDTDILQI